MPHCPHLFKPYDSFFTYNIKEDGYTIYIRFKCHNCNFLKNETVRTVPTAQEAQVIIDYSQTIGFVRPTITLGVR